MRAECEYSVANLGSLSALYPRRRSSTAADVLKTAIGR